MDAERSRRYLRAMGVQVWRPRDAGADAGWLEEQGPEEPRPAEQGLEEPKPAEQGLEEVPLAAYQEDTMATESAEPSGLGFESSPPAAADDLPTDVSALDWDRLSQTVVSCHACELHATRTQTVFGVGNRQADLMIIGEAPGADEDRQGEPFVGRAGQLLNLMLAAIGFEREQVFIANILKCRPPGNRDPRPAEALRCQPYLMRQIALVRPRVLLSVGRISAQKLLETDEPIGKLRGRWFEFGPDAIPLTVTYHPAYLLRSPEQKSKAWQDLLKVARRLRE